MYLPLESPDQIDNLFPGQEVRHSNYGICLVEKVVPEMGVILIPNNYSGVARFEMDTAKLVKEGGTAVPLIEDDYAKISINSNDKANPMGQAG